MDCSQPGSSLHGILQARTLEWVAIPFSMDSLYNSIIKNKTTQFLKMGKLSTVNRNVSRYSYCGKQYADFLKTKNMVYHMIWYHMIIISYIIWSIIWLLYHISYDLSYDPAISLVGIYTEKTIIWKDTCTLMFTAALFTITKTWKQPKRPPTDEWIKKISDIYTVEY